MMSLKSIITTTYGSSIYKSTSKLQDTLCKAASAKNQYIFLNRCIHHHLLPKFLQIKCPLRSKRARNITAKYKQELLVSTKNDARQRYFVAIKKAKELRLQLQHILSPEHFEIVINATESSREKKFIACKNKLKDKFTLLYSSKYQTSDISRAKEKLVKDCILNLTGEEIPKHHKELLNLGPKFAVTPNKIPYMDIITTTEVHALKLEYNNQLAAAEKLRQDVKIILSNAKVPKSNLNNSERQAIKEIKSRADVEIYSYDKGNGFACIKHDDSTEKMMEGIGKCKILKFDPTNTHVKKIQDLLVSIGKEIIIPKELYRKLYPSDAIPPRAYGQCKAHKPSKNYPFRILVSTIGTAPYKISEYLVKIIQPTLNKSVHMVKNSKSFVDEAKTWIIDPDEVQVSYDVVALYPSVPVKKAIENLIDILNRDINEFKERTIFKLKHIKQLIEVCLYKSYFLWSDKIHCLSDSGPIGLSLMVVLAESFLQTLESRSLIIARSLPTPVAPKTHKRYVDDTHDRFQNVDESEAFLKILNDQEPRIKFEAEYENENNKLNFLDTTIINTKEGNYNFKLYRKDAITNIQIKPNSCHDEKIKLGVFKGYISRAKAICSPVYLEQELDFIINVFVENGYERKVLKNIVKNHGRPKREEEQNKHYVSLPWIPGLSTKLKKCFRNVGYSVSFKSPPNLKQLLTANNKDKLPPNSHPGVYVIPCECQGGYTGETKKRVSSRRKEHEKDVFLENIKDSALAEHSSTCNRKMQWSKARTIAVETDYFRRHVRESLEIRKNKTGPDDENGINRDYGKYVKTKTWNSLLHHEKLRSSLHLPIKPTSEVASNSETTAMSATVRDTIQVSTSYTNEHTD